MRLPTYITRCMTKFTITGSKFYRSLDKLKKQIKEAKEAKKLAREEAKQAKLIASGKAVPPSESATAVDIGVDKKKKKQNKSEEEEEEDNEEEDLFTVKAVHSWSAPTEELTPIIGDGDGELKISLQKSRRKLCSTRRGMP